MHRIEGWVSGLNVTQADGLWTLQDENIFWYFYAVGYADMFSPACVFQTLMLYLTSLYY